MGVPGFQKLMEHFGLVRVFYGLESYICYLRRIVNRSNDHPIKVAVDGMFRIYRDIQTCKINKGVRNEALIRLFNSVIKNLSHGIKEVFVWEGCPPPEKQATLEARKKKRESEVTQLKVLSEELSKHTEVIFHEKHKVETESKYKVTKEQHESTYVQTQIRVYRKEEEMYRELLTLLNVPYLRAVGEADFLLAKLMCDKQVDVVFSPDVDILVHGGERLVTVKNNEFREYYLPEILEKLELTMNQFIIFMILLGTDYQPRFTFVNNLVERIELYHIIKGTDIAKGCHTLEDVLSHEKFSVVNKDRMMSCYKELEKSYEIFTTYKDKEKYPENFWGIQQISEKTQYPKIVEFFQKLFPDDFHNEDVIRIRASLEVINNVSRNMEKINEVLTMRHQYTSQRHIHRPQPRHHYHPDSRQHYHSDPRHHYHLDTEHKFHMTHPSEAKSWRVKDN
jgi:5'-3' exonuclease